MAVNHVTLQPSNNEVTMAHCTEIEATPKCIKLGFALAGEKSHKQTTIARSFTFKIL